jgi:hypothetical protein
MGGHPLARKLEFASCHFPWGEPADGYSRYNMVDHQYFLAFIEIARAFAGFCSTVGIPPQRSALNFHNLYELPRVLLEEIKATDRLETLRETLLLHARSQTLAARKLLDILDLPLTLVNENNPPIGDGDRMSIMDVFAEDPAARTSEVSMRTCMDLSHFFMTRFYFARPPEQRPSFPYLELETAKDASCKRTLDFEGYVSKLRPLHFHVSDTKTPGTNRECEGLPVGTGDTPWADVIPALARYASHVDDKLFLIVEIKGGHTVEGMEACAASERRLRGLIEDCFASGFMDAIEQRGSAS